MATCAYLSGDSTIRVNNIDCEMYLLSPDEYSELTLLLDSSSQYISLNDLFSIPESAVLQEAFSYGFSLVLIAYLTAWAYGVVINWFNPEHDRY